MKTRTKLALSLGIALIATATERALSPAVQLAANAVTVHQMAHSDAASLSTQLLGNGDGVLHWALGLVTLLAWLLVWTRKSNNNTKE